MHKKQIEIYKDEDSEYWQFNVIVETHVFELHCKHHGTYSTIEHATDAAVKFICHNLKDVE